MNNKWTHKEVSIEEIEHTEVNANTMPIEMFEQLCNNIRTSGLSSSISCYKRQTDGRYVIISGNHRFKACVELGYTTITILYAEEERLTRDEIIAIQLSHNSLHGEDDKGILKRLFDEIQSIDYKEIAYVEVDDLETETMFNESIVPVSEHFKVSLVLYRKDIELMEELLGIIRDESKRSDIVMLADGEETEEAFLQVLTSIRNEFDIKSVSITFGLILSLAKEQLMTKVTLED